MGCVVAAGGGRGLAGEIVCLRRKHGRACPAWLNQWRHAQKVLVVVSMPALSPVRSGE